MFKDQVVWITGASSGIGEALALQFAGEGARLVLSARRRDELERVRGNCITAGASEDGVLVLPLDVTDYEAMPGAMQSVLDTFGQVDLLINNAGISQRSLAVDTDMAVYRQLFEIDVLGQIALTKEVLPHMVERGSGHIAITSSVAGKVGVAFRTGYCAAKHAVMGFYDALRAEVDQFGIRVTTITPGYIQTQVAHNAILGDGSVNNRADKSIEGGMDVNRCAAEILNGFRKGKPEIAVGDGPEMKALWLKRLVPNTVFKKVALMARDKQRASS